jgi:hypothetical protein
MNRKAVYDSTEYSRNYRTINPIISMAYNGLPPTMCKLAHIIFDIILDTKRYGNKGKQKCVFEEKRIFSDINIDIQYLLMEFNPGKYFDGGLYEKAKSIENDRSNMSSKVKELDKNNVIYNWRYKDHYMFIMERDIGVWKFYNENAFIPPNTIQKIASVSEAMIDRMLVFETKLGRKNEREKVERHFIEFLNNLIKRMNPDVSSKLLKYDDNVLYYYKENIKKEINRLDFFEGTVIAPNFNLRIPPSIQRKISRIIEEESTKMSAKTDMEKELTPKSPNLTSNKGLHKERTKKRATKDRGESSKEVHNFRFDGQSLNPFDNATSFSKYYRQCVRTYSKKDPKFDNMESDCMVAGHILDDLKKINRKDITFVHDWIKYFTNYSLKGNKSQNPKHTSLGNFRTTLDKYKENYIAVA